ncbi:hypothetical protein PFICI_09013 [Pestalotiopsis fici W106-1]|uniref:DUF7730 domain-containing protein n=1 Tax=Pestalotiopsis fici (strain W106-1 / CGMCC3.15140) TaxID=1229662 RepID=W3WZ79_PESFW|nr:uncharacterized protein PFICI_09013 [Pestalotiopsis fici W106-1]ETS79160.1 hypothetical protein PFICI_09013 [Pestalotiopsis fici W106-1]
MVKLIDLGDPSHPHLTKSRQNAAVPFLQLPIEIRLKIYEYALAKAIVHVQQVKERSNKFRWRSDYLDALQKNNVVITDLELVSRQIYIDLQVHGIFYRVNELYCRRPEDLLTFLAAIAPERRAFLSNMTVRIDEDELAVLFPETEDAPTRHQGASLQHALTLLSQCQGLRRLKIVIPVDRLGLFTIIPVVASFLRRLVAAAASDSPCPSLRRISFIKPVLYFSVIGYREVNLFVDLSDQQPLRAAVADEPQFHPAEQELLNNAKQAVASLREYWQRDGNRSNETVTQEQVRQATIFARVDFPGEERTTLDRINSSWGQISSRTRQKCKKDLIDEHGVIQRARRKYDGEGILTWSKLDIHGIRWSGPNIEVDVENTSLKSKNGLRERSWEPVEAVMSTDNQGKILRHLKILFVKNDPANDSPKNDPSATLQRLREQPTPQDVMDTFPGLFGGSTPEGKWRKHAVGSRRFPKWQIELWERGQQLFLETVDHLEELVRQKEVEEKAGEENENGEGKEEMQTIHTSENRTADDGPTGSG